MQTTLRVDNLSVLRQGNCLRNLSQTIPFSSSIRSESSKNISVAITEKKKVAGTRKNCILKLGESGEPEDVNAIPDRLRTL